MGDPKFEIVSAWRSSAFKRSSASSSGRESGSPQRDAGAPAHSSVLSIRRPTSASKIASVDRRPRSAARIEEYLPILERASDVVDVGCGRGELLASLRARGVTARGIDTNMAMVDLCRSQQLDVEQADALSFLQRQADGEPRRGFPPFRSWSTSIRRTSSRFLDAAFHKMKPGAPLVLETINPACWMAFFETYIRDLTHQRPLHPDTLRYLVEASGFSSVDVRFRQPVSEGDRLETSMPAPSRAVHPAVAAVASAVNDHAEKLNTRLFSSMDYAVIARR